MKRLTLVLFSSVLLTAAALSAPSKPNIIERYKNDPFFLYIAYRAPHTPLDAPKSYTDRFPGEMPERRRQALGMISAVDDGVGLITATLKKHNLTERTVVFVIGDNGAPLKIHMEDSPLKGDPGGWDGILEITPEPGAEDKSPFIVRSSLQLAAPVTARLSVRSSSAGEASFAWRTAEQKEFLPENKATFAVTASQDWQTHQVPLPAKGTIIHLRLHLPGGATLLRDIQFEPSEE